VFQLCAREDRQHIRRQIARPDIDPVVLVDLAPEKSGPIRSLLSKNFGALIKLGIIDQQCTAFSA
jgi:hypothetical protein